MPRDILPQSELYDRAHNRRHDPIEDHTDWTACEEARSIMRELVIKNLILTREQEEYARTELTVREEARVTQSIAEVEIQTARNNFVETRNNIWARASHKELENIIRTTDTVKLEAFFKKNTDFINSFDEMEMDVLSQVGKFIIANSRVKCGRIFGKRLREVCEAVQTQRLSIRNSEEISVTLV